MASSDGMDLTGPWRELARLGQELHRLMHEGITTALHRVGNHLSQKIVDGLTSQAPAGEQFDPLHWFTIHLRNSRGGRKKRKPKGGAGGPKALLDRGDLFRNVDYVVWDVPGQYAVFIGVKRGQSNKGKDIADIAALQETGYIIEVTPRMRFWLRRNGFPIRDTTTALRVPARPFIAPVYNQEAATIREYLQQAMLPLLNEWNRVARLGDNQNAQ